MATSGFTIAQVLDSDTADVFFKGVEGTISGKRHLFESKQTKFDRVQFETINEILKKITGQTVNWAQNGAGSAKFFLKASEASGSTIHEFVKGAGAALGYESCRRKFRWTSGCRGPFTSLGNQRGDM